MPELPEVETTRRGIEPLVANKTVDAGCDPQRSLALAGAG